MNRPSPEKLNNQSDDLDFIQRRLQGLNTIPQAKEIISSGESRSKVYSFFAEKIAEKSENPKEAALFSVIGKLSAVDAMLELDRIRSGAASSSSKERLKKLKVEHVIPFNHALKDLINDFPNMELQELQNILSNAHTHFFDDVNLITGKEKTGRDRLDDKPNTEYQLFAAINGMRHEMAAEVLLSAAGVDYSFEVSAENDAKGADIYVNVDGRMEKIDIKASERARDRAHEDWPGLRAVWTGLESKHFTGMNNSSHDALAIPYSTAEEKAADFIAAIESTVRQARKAEARRRSAISQKALVNA